MNLTIRDVALLHGVSPRQVQRYISTGHEGHLLPAHHKGRRLVVTDTDYALWLLACGFEPKASAPILPEAAILAETANNNAKGTDLSHDHPEDDPVVLPKTDHPAPEPEPASMFRPANPGGPLTNVPHAQSGNWPSPETCRLYLENEARKMKQRLQGGTDNND